MDSRSFSYVRRNLCLAILAMLAVTGCAQTEYLNQGEQSANPMARTVRADLKDEFFRVAPACVAVLPAVSVGPSSPQMATFIERAVARHLSQRVPTVIGPDQRRDLARRLTLDVSNPDDRHRFLKGARCDAFIEPQLMASSDDYFVIWSSRSIDLRLRMFQPSHAGDGDEGKLLWIARHATSRGDGGFPLDIASLSIGAIKASSHQMDQEMNYSIVEDAVRRMMVTLPDTRGGIAYGETPTSTALQVDARATVK